ncbi:OCIA domain-containing protein 2-like [Myxocyprinus asiaticus]|uniref:OCIA domain-containing protein 2-like n=1 Tax=Myxocyprinus asiaticus TaxID=70543 RepID=UPI002223AA08|nr:OCIA domain-containing protein 2-like [Myxocyprinus asiaticus]
MNEKDMTTETNQSTGGGMEDVKHGQAQWKVAECVLEIARKTWVLTVKGSLSFKETAVNADSIQSDPHFPRDDLKQIWKECQNESFWYQALPLSVGSMTVTWPHIQCLSYAVGKASYVGTCREKFNKLGPEFTKAFCSDFGPPGFGAGGFGPGHRHCIHVCEK